MLNVSHKNEQDNINKGITVQMVTTEKYIQPPVA